MFLFHERKQKQPRYIEQICPICLGSGRVPGGFYLRAGLNTWTSDHTTEECRRCKGVGTIRVKQEES